MWKLVLAVLVFPTLFLGELVTESVESHLWISALLSLFFAALSHVLLRIENDAAAMSLIQILHIYGMGSLFWFLVFFLFGAPCSLRTVLFSIVESTLTVGMISLGFPRKDDFLAVLWGLDQLPGGRSSSLIEARIRGAIYGSVLGLYVGAIPIPLDWDQPWQVWPVSLFVPSLVGWLIGWAWVPRY